VIARLGNPRVLGVLLAVSVAANLFMGGVLAGRFAGQATQGSQSKRTFEAMLAPLPEEKRALVRNELRAAMPQLRRDHAALQEARAALAAELVKPSPDPAALDRGFAEVQARSTAIQAAFQQSFKRASASLSQEERRAVVEALARRSRPRALPEF
jgi:uncharacterized membrane protein